jgi:hypothetical protein
LLLVARKTNALVDTEAVTLTEPGASTQSTVTQQQLQLQPLCPSQSDQRRQRHKVKQSSVEMELISLQKQTLAEVKRLADLQAMRLEVEKEMLLLKKAKLMASGVAHLDEQGCWVLTVAENKEE